MAGAAGDEEGGRHKGISPKRRKKVEMREEGRREWQRRLAGSGRDGRWLGRRKNIYDLGGGEG